jgi:hypothetical protein
MHTTAYNAYFMQKIVVILNRLYRLQRGFKNAAVAYTEI